MESFTSVYYACMKQFGCVILYCLVVSRVFTTVLDLESILVVPYFITSQTTSIRQWKRLSLWGFITSWVIRVLQLIAKACRQHV